MDAAWDRALADRQSSSRNLGQLLHSLSPNATVQRGFTLTLDEKGNPVTSAGALKKGDRIKTRFSDGETESVVD